MRSLAATLIVLATAVPPAAASTQVTNYSSTGEIAITADGRSNRLRIELTDNRARWRIHDSEGLVENTTGDPTCVRGDDFHTLLCDRAPRRQARIQSLFARGGNDRVVLGQGVRGMDISGDAGRDILKGANLADRLNGGAGKDTVTGAGGKDRLYGAGGNDVLNARDRAEDGLIECDGIGGGTRGGDDVARVDPADRPSATCERVEQ